MSFGIVLSVLALAGGLLYRTRLLRAIAPRRPALTDDMVREIEERGRVAVDDPLDLEQIQEEEARFWEEHPWEEPDEF